MSLMQLLAVGHSVVGIKDAPSRYKLQENWLPRFGPASAAPAGPAGGVAGAPLPAAAPAVQSGFVFVDAPTAERPAISPPGGEGVPGTAVSPAPAVATPNATPLANLDRKPRLTAPLKRKARPRPGGGGPTLDRVRVMRNDLSDADLEVVPAGSGDGEAAETPELAGPASGSAWGRLAARLFQASRGLF